ncbi:MULTISPECIES: DUF3108 domain-containing protein [Thiomicrorhabdus]|uniref:DUF3108 domain-containing protein n=1 Tax=Thiomicrorhabdus heinhorstiae TaxID=2748010 RepID=A0ABS0BWR9_9GAMM|nr:MULTISPECIES: DUF3108 domain-containing protein [Thiomicrorhabdus]MBF6058256.1 DUF3108 domain-containing protein [Thiomicrorhabdus heinhorstiae]
MKLATTFKATVFTLSLTLIPALAQAQSIPPFNADFAVNAFGFNLGLAHQKMTCDKELNCTIESIAKPKGWISNFVDESSVESIALQQSDEGFQWLSYQKTTLKNDKVAKIETLKLDSDEERIEYVEKQRFWPQQDNAYDASSLAYAIQYWKLNNKPLEDFYLQDSKLQQKLTFNTIDQAVKLELPFQKKDVNALRYDFSSEQANIQLWLLPDYDYFPGKIRIENTEEDRVIVLTLAKPPQFQ